MSAVALGPHRARLFPLPFLAPVDRPTSTSARIRQRFLLRRTIGWVTNRCIFSLNRLYDPSAISSFSPSSQPDKSPSLVSCAQPCPSLSAAQQRVLTHLLGQCTAFVRQARTWRLLGPGRDVPTSVLDALSSNAAATLSMEYAASPFAAGADDSLIAPVASELDSFLPSSSSFSSAATPVVPLLADRVALPEQLNIVPMARVLPPTLAAVYSQPSRHLLRSAHEVFVREYVQPLRRPRVAGSRSEYVRLVGRMQAEGMLGFTAEPRAVNGVFTVAKDDASDRLIIDAQPANRLFVDSPHVQLPGPSHLVQLQVPAGATVYVGKSDLSNFYHHIGLEPWMQPYFALPPLTPAELRQLGLPTDAAFPMCVTLPMGFSHAVFIAQHIHEHVVYSSGALNPQHSVLQLTSPVVSASHPTHAIIIDDMFELSLDQAVAVRAMQRSLAAYRAAGFVVKLSKVVMPTSKPVKVIGFEIHGATGTIALPNDSQRSLVLATLAAIHRPTLSGIALAHLIGRWTWVMMLRRPCLAILQQVYRYCQCAQRRLFTVWPSVRRELLTLLSVLPLLTANLRQSVFHRALASDASEVAAGVVSTHVTPCLSARLWPLCSARHHAVQQTKLNAVQQRALLGRGDAASDPGVPGADVNSDQLIRFDSYYDAVSEADWRVIVSSAWRDDEHINVLELRAALLAIHHALTYPSSLCSRVFLLLDSTVAFFSLWKGRSSSPALLLVLRKVSALLLAGGISLMLGWLPSASNPADAPSRLRCPAGLPSP
jgi:hypothetical protein